MKWVKVRVTMPSKQSESRSRTAEHGVLVSGLAGHQVEGEHLRLGVQQHLEHLLALLRQALLPACAHGSALSLRWVHDKEPQNQCVEESNSPMGISGPVRPLASPMSAGTLSSHRVHLQP